MNTDNNPTESPTLDYMLRYLYDVLKVQPENSPAREILERDLRDLTYIKYAYSEFRPQ